MYLEKNFCFQFYLFINMSFAHWTFSYSNHAQHVILLIKQKCWIYYTFYLIHLILNKIISRFQFASHCWRCSCRWGNVSSNSHCLCCFVAKTHKTRYVKIILLLKLYQKNTNYIERSWPLALLKQDLLPFAKEIQHSCCAWVCMCVSI